MTEPLVSTVPGVEEAQPPRRTLVFDRITFEEGKLWMPRYGSLVQRGLPHVQWEPGLQIRTKRPLKVEITFEIEAGQGVTFVREGDRVRCRAIDDPEAEDIAGLVEARWESETRCTLVWDQSAANQAMQEHFQDSDRRKEITVLRIFCDGGADPRDEREDALTKVEGGLYLACIYNPNDRGRSLLIDPPPIFPDPRPPGGRIAQRAEIRVLDIDSHSRPVYDLFRPFLEQNILDPDLELEPTLRVREGESAELDLTLDMPRLRGLRWRAWRGEARVTPFSTDARPLQLQTCEVLEKTCRIRWVQKTGRDTCATGTPEATRCYCTHGHVSSFLFSVDAFNLPEEEVELWQRDHPTILPHENPRKILSRMAIDPTVIQPPSCTPDGVCIPPERAG